MSDRCSCTPHWQDAGGGYTEYVPEWEPTCPAHGDVDALIAVGEYVDRRGRPWAIVGYGGKWGLVDERGFAMGGVLTEPSQMRRRIVREQHREVCPGLRDCEDHPAPHVIVWLVWRGAQFEAFPPHGNFGLTRDTFAEAIDAAQQLAREAT